MLAERRVTDIVAMPLILRGERRGEIGKRVRSVLDKVGLGARANALPSQLSAGEKLRKAKWL